MNTDALFPLASAGIPIVFLEPSCLSAVRDDAPALLRGELQRKAARVAESARLFEDWLDEQCQDNPAIVSFRSGPTKILFHGHCHQKAMGMTAPSRAILSRIPGATIVDLDAGCCGMAGSFGYMRDHFTVSVAIAERRLLPAARALKSGEALVATGTSCRAQVADLAGVTARHPVELLHSLLTEPK